MKDNCWKIHITADGLDTVQVQWFERRDYDHLDFLCDVEFDSDTEAQSVIDGVYRLLGKSRFQRIMGASLDGVCYGLDGKPIPEKGVGSE